MLFKEISCQEAQYREGWTDRAQRIFGSETILYDNKMVDNTSLHICQKAQNGKCQEWPWKQHELSVKIMSVHVHPF